MDTKELQRRIRLQVRGAYDLQGLRIQMGNRLCAQFKAKLGLKPGQAEKDSEEEIQKALDLLRSSYQKITDGVVTKRDLIPRGKFKGDELISDYTEFVLVHQYLAIEKEEKRHFIFFKDTLEQFPIYNQFLEPTKGIGVTMAGVILSEFDIHAAKYASSLWRYAGLDVAWDGRGRSKNVKHLVPTIHYKSREEGEERVEVADEVIEKYQAKADEAWEQFLQQCVPTMSDEMFRKESDKVLARIKEGLPKELDVKRSASWNHLVKTKMVGVLSDLFIKMRTPPYRTMYDQYKARLQQHPIHKDKTGLHRERMAKRYIIKRFLVDLYMNWRPLEGLPVHDEYAKAKLGLDHGNKAA